MPSTIKHDFMKELSVAEARAILDEAVKRHRKEIAKRNKAFQALPDYKKRVVIAQDVLDQLEARRLIPTYGTYLSPGDKVEHDYFDSYGDHYDEDREVSEALDGAKCEVCGIGSLFIAAVDRANGCTVGDLGSPNSDSAMRNYLSDWFADDQLSMIEAAFEGRFIDWSAGDSGLHEYSPEIRQAIAFTRRTTSPTARIKKIMNNIIENKGTFKP